MTDFILQGAGTGACCTLVAVCNAARWFHGVSPDIGSSEWFRLRKLGLGQYGPLARPVTVAAELGLDMRLLENEPLTFPCVITVPDPHVRGVHAVLVLEANPENAVMVNYHWLTGPVIEVIPWSQARRAALSEAHRKAWSITPRPKIVPQIVWKH